jgi:hypothetical protein
MSHIRFDLNTFAEPPAGKEPHLAKEIGKCCLNSINKISILFCKFHLNSISRNHILFSKILDLTL